MSLFDTVLGAAQNSTMVAQLSQKTGLDPATVSRAIAALAQGHRAEGDTVQHAANHSTLDPATLQTILAHLGGEEGLARLLQKLDRDGDGNPLNDVTGLASGLFGKR